MAKARVHELAKEFGVPSKDVLAALKDMGEFVKSASSTVEAPVARRLEELHGDAWKKAAEEKAAKKAAKKAPAKKAAADNGAPAATPAEVVKETPVEATGGPAITDEPPAAPETPAPAAPRPSAPSVESTPARPAAEEPAAPAGLPRHVPLRRACREGHLRLRPRRPQARPRRR